MSIDSFSTRPPPTKCSPRFLLLRRVDVVHVGLKARERRGREAELGREGLEPGRCSDRHRVFLLSSFLSIAKEEVVKKGKRFSLFFFFVFFLSLTNVTRPSSSATRTPRAERVLSWTERRSLPLRVSARVSRTECSLETASKAEFEEEEKTAANDDADEAMPTTNSGAAVPRNTRSSSLAGRSSGSLRDEDDDDDDYDDDEDGGRLSELYPRCACRFFEEKEQSKKIVGFFNSFALSLT